MRVIKEPRFSLSDASVRLLRFVVFGCCREGLILGLGLGCCVVGGSLPVDLALGITLSGDDHLDRLDIDSDFILIR